MEKFECTQEIIDCLTNGAFLTTSENGKINTMTISWGNIGLIWGKRIFTAMVRDTRFTKTILDNTMEFTISIPTDNSLKTALGICGSKSGKDMDKIEECHLELISSETVTVPTVKCNGIAIECKVVYKQRMDISTLGSEIKEKWYEDENMHTMYYGEITNIRKL